MSLTIMQLLLPAALGAVLAWIASASLHVALKFHNADYKALANEDEIAAAIRAANPEKGVHSVPFVPDMKDMANPDMQKKFETGPVSFITIFDNGMPNMPKLLVQQILYFLIGALLVGYCASLALEPGAEYLDVFRFVSAVGFLAFGWAVVPFSIWYGHTWATCARYLVDALIYGLLIAGAYAWLWPAAV